MVDLTDIVREPHASEMDFFRKNPHVGGMATRDDRVIVNPFSPLTPQEKESIVINETSRVVMKKQNFRPNFELTAQQKANLKGTSYEKNPRAARETIAARLLTGDPSGGEPTGDQMAFVDALRKMVFGLR